MCYGQTDTKRSHHRCYESPSSHEYHFALPQKGDLDNLELSLVVTYPYRHGSKHQLTLTVSYLTDEKLNNLLMSHNVESLTSLLWLNVLRSSEVDIYSFIELHITVRE
jgi:hypothetical protein